MTSSRTRLVLIWLLVSLGLSSAGVARADGVLPLDEASASANATPPTIDGDATPNAPAATPATLEDPASTAGPAGEQGLTLVIDPGATAALEACLARPDLGTPEGDSCLLAVMAGAPNSTAAFRAQNLLDAARLQRAMATRVTAPTAVPDLPAPVAAKDDDANAAAEKAGMFDDLPVSFRLTTGRFELSAAAGVFGIWNGIAGGIITQSFVSYTNVNLNPGLIILGSGALSAGLGASYAAGGFMLSDDSMFGSNGARLATTGLFVGSVFGIASAFSVADLIAPANLPPEIVVASTVGTVVAGGYVGAAAGAASAFFLDLDAGQVSLVNAGVALGMFNGLLLIPNLTVWNTPIWVNSAAFMGISTLGLGAGYAMSELLEYTWVEALILGGGAALGVAALWPATSLAGPFLGVPFGGPVAAAYYTVPAALGSVGGFGIAAGALAAWRVFHDEPILNDKWFSGLRPVPGSVRTVFDKEGQPVTVAPLVAAQW